MIIAGITLILLCGLKADTKPQFHVELDATKQAITCLGWDTEGSGRHERNLLCKDRHVAFEVRTAGKWSSLDMPLVLRYSPTENGFDLLFSIPSGRPGEMDALRLAFPFDPGVTPTTVLPAGIDPEGAFHAPCIVSAPDFGQMLVTVTPSVDYTSRLIGSRKLKTLDWIVDIPWPSGTAEITLRFIAVRLPAPVQLKDDIRWKQARRGWFNGLNLTSQWGDQEARFSAPAGILGNNVLSDPASCSLWMYADMALFVPELPGGIKTSVFLRRSLDHWLDHRTKPDGNVIGYWDYDVFLDALPGILISAWDYVEMSGDRSWLTSRIEQLERIADYAVSRDVDHDGLMEAVPTGNRGSLLQPKRSSCWFDAINFGCKDAYSNALLYRAFRCLGDMETRLHRTEKAATYTRRADSLKRAYATGLMNPATDWVAMWKSEDGQLHDYASPIVNGYAIEYGLIDRERGRAILKKLHAKLDRVGFINYQFGVPCVLDPILPGDYLQPAIGAPQQADGRDTWQIYMNGGITAGQVYHYLAAHYVAGLNEDADRLLDSMLRIQDSGGFQNGVRDAFPKGIDWRKWNGDPCGYEGFLADNARFLLAVLTRHAEFRHRLYRPLE